MPTSWLTMSAVLSAVLMIVLALSVWFDVSEHRIPNWLTVGGLVGALALRGIMGPEALTAGVYGGALGFALGIVLFAIGAMGAGDGKLLTAVGAALGWEVFLYCLPLIGIFGGLMTLGMTAWKGTLIPTLFRAHQLFFYLVSFGRIGDRRTLTTQGSVAIPYGVPVAAGAIAAWLGWGLTL